MMTPVTEIWPTEVFQEKYSQGLGQLHAVAREEWNAVEVEEFKAFFEDQPLAVQAVLNEAAPLMMEQYPMRTLERIETRVKDTKEKLQVVLDLKSLLAERTRQAFADTLRTLKQHGSVQETLLKLSPSEVSNALGAFRFIEKVYHVPITEEKLAGPLLQMFYPGKPYGDSLIFDTTVPETESLAWMQREAEMMNFFTLLEQLSRCPEEQKALSEWEEGGGI